MSVQSYLSDLDPTKINSCSEADIIAEKLEKFQKDRSKTASNRLFVAIATGTAGGFVATQVTLTALTIASLSTLLLGLVTIGLLYSAYRNNAEADQLRLCVVKFNQRGALLRKEEEKNSGGYTGYAIATAIGFIIKLIL